MPLSRASTRGRYSRIEGVTGNDAIFVVIDKLTKVAHFLPIKESITAAQLAELYTSRIVSLQKHRIGKREYKCTQQDLLVAPSMRLYLPHVEAQLRGIIALKAYVVS